MRDHQRYFAVEDAAGTSFSSYVLLPDPTETSIKTIE